MADESWRVPTPVQELAATLEEPPSRYVLREKDRPGSPLVADDMPEPLPVINLSRLSEDTLEAAKLESALQSWGLVLVSELPIYFPFFHFAWLSGHSIIVCNIYLSYLYPAGNQPWDRNIADG